MAQIFRPVANTIIRVVIVAMALGLGGLLVLGNALQKSPTVTRVNIPPEQDVAFNHQRHAQLGLDCRFCHAAVENSAFAGFPATQTCMNCHKMILSDAPALEPVWESLDTGKPLRWNRVHDLPRFVYFDHSIHFQAGVSCVACHGRVEEMARVSKQSPLYMKDCLNCHRAPERLARFHENIFDRNGRPLTDALAKGQALSPVHAMDDAYRRVLDCYTERTLECGASADDPAIEPNGRTLVDRLERNRASFPPHGIDPAQRRLLDCYSCHR